MVRKMLPAGFLSCQGSTLASMEQLLFDYHDDIGHGVCDLSVSRNDCQAAAFALASISFSQPIALDT
jgi:hypothetical protein